MHCALNVDVCGLFSSPVAPGKAQWREGQEEDTPAETWAVGSSAHFQPHIAAATKSGRSKKHLLMGRQK